MEKKELILAKMRFPIKKYNLKAGLKRAIETPVTRFSLKFILFAIYTTLCIRLGIYLNLNGDVNTLSVGPQTLMSKLDHLTSLLHSNNLKENNENKKEKAELISINVANIKNENMFLLSKISALNARLVEQDRVLRLEQSRLKNLFTKKLGENKPSEKIVYSHKNFKIFWLQHDLALEELMNDHQKVRDAFLSAHDPGDNDYLTKWSKLLKNQKYGYKKMEIELRYSRRDFKNKKYRMGMVN